MADNLSKYRSMRDFIATHGHRSPPFGGGGARRPHLQDGDLMAVIRVTTDYGPTADQVAKNRAYLWVAAIVVGFVSMFSLWAVVRYVIVKPVTHLRDVANALSDHRVNIVACETTTGSDTSRTITPDGLRGSDFGKRFDWRGGRVACIPGVDTGAIVFFNVKPVDDVAVDVEPGGERALGVAEEHVDHAVAAGHGHVGVAIEIEIGGDERDRTAGDGERELAAEAAEAVAEADGHEAAGVGDDGVGVAVAVEVARARVGRARCEAGRPGARRPGTPSVQQTRALGAVGGTLAPCSLACAMGGPGPSY